MRRRLTVALVAMVVGTLVVVGAVLAVVETRDVRATTRSELVREAQGVARTVQAEAQGSPGSPAADPALRLRSVLRALAKPLSLQGEAVVAVGPNGRVFNPGTGGNSLPNRAVVVERTRLEASAATLLAGDPVSGVVGNTVFAAYPYRAGLRIGHRTRTVTQAVVLTRSAPSGLGQAWPWLAVTAAAIIALAAGVADRLGRRIVAPLRSAEAVTGRIAAGDLAARVPEPAGTDPELASLIRSVNAMAAGLDRSQAAERDFLLSVSHELRTPLTSIRGYAEAIDDGAAEPSAAARVILRESGRLDRLVGDLLELAKVRSGSFGVRREQVDLGDVVTALTGSFLPAAAEVGVELSVTPGPAVARADPDRVAQIAANLVENALRYARSRVHVGAGVIDGRAAVWVDDDGPGVAADALPHLFDRLFTTSDHHGRPVGSGLGLAIVAELAGAMGGAATARSPLSDQGGTRLMVALPPA